MLQPSRGLRQVYPLSPFLLILVMEGLGRRFGKACEVGHIHGIHLYGKDLPISHQ